MNARQKAKKQKKIIRALKSDNALMREIIADSPAMQELYNSYTQPTFIIHSPMEFHEYRSKVFLSSDILDDAGLIETLKQELADELVEEIKENITYEVGTEGLVPTITASFFVGRK